MEHLTLHAVEAAVRAAWALDTCDEVDVDDWTPANPARGQCGASTLVLHDLFGGRLVDAEVRDGDHVQGHHSWLRTAGGIDVDLTREQFSETETVGTPRVFERPQLRPRRCVTQYEILHARVFGALGLDPALPPA